MIPLRILLKGFLCYREEQEVLFDGSSLWLLAGLNGSGKSAIFDAVTYALFGHHRGGSQQASELINHECTSMQVEFDFRLDRQQYQIRRTLTRRPNGTIAATQQIHRLHPGLTGEASREAIPDTSRRREFDAWIRDHIGLNYDTFTSSVLLLQGRAERLLDATATGRFEVLAGIVDLERYRRLHERADQRRKELKTRVQMLQHQVEGLAAVTEEQLAHVEAQILATEQEKAQAQAEVERLKEQEQRSYRWADLVRKREDLDQRWQRSQGLLHQKEEIEQKFARLRELREVLPLVKTATTRRGEITRAEKLLDQCAKEDLLYREKLDQVGDALKQARQKADTVQKHLTQAEQRQGEAQQRLVELTSHMSLVTHWERQTAEVDKLTRELERLPADIPEALEKAKQLQEEVVAAGHLAPLLTRLHDRRQELRQARDREQMLQEAKLAITQRGTELKRAHQKLEVELKTATEKVQLIREQAVKTQLLREQAQSHLRTFGDLRGAKECQHCGQPLTPEHYAQEKHRREQAVEQTEKTWEQVNAAHREAARIEKECVERFATSTKTLEEARTGFHDNKNELEKVRAEIERLTRDCTQVWDELPEPHRTRVALASAPATAEAWLATTYPSADDLAQVRTLAQKKAAVLAQVREAEKRHEQWRDLKTKLQIARQTLQEIEGRLPDQVGRIRREHGQMTTEVTAGKQHIATLRTQQKEIQQERERLERERADLERGRTEIAGKKNTAETTIKLSREEIDRIRKQAPPAWHLALDRADMGAIFQWEGERDRLAAEKVEDRHRELDQATRSLEHLKQQRDELASEMEQFPPEARRSPQEVQHLLVTARQQLSTCEKAVNAALHERSVLHDRRQQRQELEQEHLKVQTEHNRFELIADLLGRNRLQRHLVRQAERQVVDHANGVLDRISGGQLYLRLRGGEDGDAMADRALELEAYNRSSTQAPINVAFLSGSQRFRVAVSLALGLGQYASRQHRPIESVIIDEGFGCLDRQGRQVMIQELQNLRGQLRCILLVSHQEEFADAFADGYHFELTSDGTRVKRFHR